MNKSQLIEALARYENLTLKKAELVVNAMFVNMAEALVRNERIEFSWDAEEGSYQTQVVMTFEPLPDGTTLVRVAEGGWRENPAGLKNSYLNCYGWTQMLCCLKAWAEHGINLRRGFF